MIVYFISLCYNKSIARGRSMNLAELILIAFNKRLFGKVKEKFILAVKFFILEVPVNKVGK
jgi:hypothetical protein